MKLKLALGLCLLAAVAVVWWGCSNDSPTMPAATEQGTGSAYSSGLTIAPIEGLTTRWHRAPDRFAVPNGIDVKLRCLAPEDAIVTWTGANEVSRDAMGSIAVCPAAAAGAHTVRVDVTLTDTGERGKDNQRPGGTSSSHTCEFVVVEIDVSDIRVGPVEVTREPLQVDNGSSNGQTMMQYFGGSIASVVKLADDHYVTAAGTKITVRTKTEPAAFGALTEWRVGDQGVVLGERADYTLKQISGENVVSVGPVDGGRDIRLDTYSVNIVQMNGPGIIDGTPAVFAAVTTPPGYEDQVTWLSSTKHGSAMPVVGTGRLFTVTFSDTWGPDNMKWLGVRADNAIVGEDAPCPANRDPYSTVTVPGTPTQETAISFGTPDVPAIPADFFGPGSDPFTGTVVMAGMLMDPNNFGMTDTQVQRAGPVHFPGAGFPRPSDPIPVEMVELSLVGIAPITVTYNGGQNPESWVVGMGLSSNQQQGQLNAVLVGPSGGDYTATLPVKPLLSFAMESELALLEASSITPNQVQVRILDWHAEGLPPVILSPTQTWPFSTTPPNDGSYFNPCEQNNAFPFFPGYLPGGAQPVSGGLQAASSAAALPPWPSVGGGFYWCARAPYPLPVGVCTLSGIGTMSLACNSVCPAPGTLQVGLACTPPTPPLGCPSYAVAPFLCDVSGFCVGYYATPGCVAP